MFIQDNVPLQAYTTMRLGGVAAFLSEVNERQDIPELVNWAKERDIPILMIGDGSNIVWRDEGFPGLVMVNKLMKYEVYNQDENTMYLTVGGGENWDKVVEKVVEDNWNGIAELSLIPGTAGATPVQNVGAYGREISDVLMTIEAFDLVENKFLTIPASECGFSYRSSRFKTTDKHRFLIASITLQLTKMPPRPPYYDVLQTYFDDHNIVSPTPAIIRNAVVEIRTAKLPDPKLIANNGSFFKNPVIDLSDFTQLQADNPDVKYWHTDDKKVKISAAWLLEKAGFANNHDKETGMSTWPNQPLVLVNEHANSTADLLKYKQKIVDTIQSMFGITLEQEPELLP